MLLVFWRSICTRYCGTLRGVEHRARRAIERSQTGVVQILHLEFESARVAETAQRRRRQDQYASFLHHGELLANGRQQFLTPQVRVFAFVEPVQDEKCRADIGLVGLQHGRIA